MNPEKFMRFELNEILFVWRRRKFVGKERRDYLFTVRVKHLNVCSPNTPAPVAADEDRIVSHILKLDFKLNNSFETVRLLRASDRQ